MPRLNAVQLRVPSEPVYVEPGGSSTFEIDVFNASEVVDEYALDTVGIDPRWVSIEPARLSLFPSTGGTALVTIAVGSPYAVRAGRHRIGVRARSTIEQNRARVEEVPIDVAPAAGSLIELHPVNIRGGRAGAGVAVVRNLGNTILEVDVRGSDPESALIFEVSPPHLTIPPGDEAWTVVEIKGQRPLMGMDVAHQFEVSAYTGDPDMEPPSAAGNFIQSPWLPDLVTRLVGLVVLVVLLVAGFVIGSKIVSGDLLGGPAAEATATPEAAPGKPGDLKSPTANTETLAAGASGNVTVSFTLDKPFPATGMAVVTFPEGFALNADGNTELTAVTGFDGKHKLEVKDRSAVITRGGDGTPTASGVAVTLVLSHVRNPGISGPTKELAVEVRDAKGNPVNVGVIPPLTLTAGQLIKVAALHDNAAAGASGGISMTFVLANDLPGDGQIQVVFPKGYGLANAQLGAGAVVVPPPGGKALEKGGSLKLKVDGQALLITRADGGDVVKAGSTMTIALTSVANPGVAGKTAVFELATRNKDGLAIDHGEAPPATITSGKLGAPAITLANPAAGATGNVSVLLTLPGELSGGSRILVKFPVGFTLNKDGPTVVLGNAAAGLGGSVAAVATGQTAIVIRATDGALAPAGSVVSVTLTNIQNPAAAGPAGAITVDTEDAAGNPIASGISEPVVLGAAAAPAASATPTATAKP